MSPSIRHPADSQDLIRVQGARVNNLKDISVEIRHGLAHRSTHH
jgi:excinuclease UvrABC ATPase subunit